MAKSLSTQSQTWVCRSHQHCLPVCCHLSTQLKMSVSAKGMRIRWVVVVLTGVALVSMVNAKSPGRNVQTATFPSKEGIERIRVDPDKGQEEIDLPERKFRILHDFKRGLTVFRASMTGTPACYLYPLKKTGMIPPKALARYIQRGGDLEKAGKSKIVKYDLVIDDEEVTDISFLSDRAHTMCKDLSVHWLRPNNQKGGPKKRFWFGLAAGFISAYIMG